MRRAPGIEFRTASVERGPGAVLLDAMRREIAATYDGLDLDGPDMPRAGARELGPPGGTFLVAEIENFNANPVATWFAEKSLR
ncbi:MAG TPA: hypothetical protein VFN65_08450 [Solirubrobacteraceae bacterium]|nr:hypothetical protein [Solirubrobacteraceae bacterium]